MIYIAFKFINQWAWVPTAIHQRWWWRRCRVARRGSRWEGPIGSDSRWFNRVHCLRARIDHRRRKWRPELPPVRQGLKAQPLQRTCATHRVGDKDSGQITIAAKTPERRAHIASATLTLTAQTAKLRPFVAWITGTNGSFAPLEHLNVGYILGKDMSSRGVGENYSTWTRAIQYG